MKLIIFHSHFCEYGGCETFVYDFCSKLRNHYSIKVLYHGGDYNQIRRLSRLVEIEKYDETKVYDCDLMIRNSSWGIEPEQIKAKLGIYVQMIHADYEEHKKNNTFIYKKWNKTTHHVACGENVAEKFIKTTGYECTPIKNILDYRQPTNKVIRLITCSRLDKLKGWGRMQQMMKMMKDNKIKFIWTIFTNSPMKSEYEEVIFMKPRFDIWDYLADADYTVLLSDIEGLPYTVQESLQYDVPCIVTDTGGCTELIKNKINGYVVPMDMNFDINIIKKIPKISDYKSTEIEDWTNFLGYAEYKEKPIREEIDNMYKVRAIENFTLERFNECINIVRFDKSEDNKIFKLDVFEVDNDLYNYLNNNHVIELVEIIEKVSKPSKETKKNKKQVK